MTNAQEDSKGWKSKLDNPHDTNDGCPTAPNQGAKAKARLFSIRSTSLGCRPWAYRAGATLLQRKVEETELV